MRFQQGSSRWAVAGESATAVYLEGAWLADPEVKAALVALVGENGPPLVAHRAKELMRALNVDMRNLDRDTAVMAYVLDPSESKYRLEDLFRRSSSEACAEILRKASSRVIPRCSSRSKRTSIGDSTTMTTG